MRLKNGATPIIDRDPGLVLAEWHKGGRMEYITWQIDSDGHCYHGHYFRDMIDALADYRQRYAKMKGQPA